MRKLDDVKNFFFKHYTPANAILVVAGNVTTEQVKQLGRKMVCPIPAGEKYNRNLPQEPPQTAPRYLDVQADVPLMHFIKPGIWIAGSKRATILPN